MIYDLESEELLVEVTQDGIKKILIQHFQNGLVKKWVCSTTINYFSSCRRQVSLKTLQKSSVCNCHLSIIEIILDLAKCTFSLKENFTL